MMRDPRTDDGLRRWQRRLERRTDTCRLGLTAADRDSLADPAACSDAVQALRRGKWGRPPGSHRAPER